MLDVKHICVTQCNMLVLLRGRAVAVLCIALPVAAR